MLIAVYLAAFSTLRRSEVCGMNSNDLRHYSASIMHAIGIPDQYIMQHENSTQKIKTLENSRV